MILLVAVAAACLYGQDLTALPLYQPQQTVSGIIRLWGNDYMRSIAKYWQEGFRRYHPEVKFQTKLMGTGTGMAGLYSGIADLALMGRESTAKEIMAFEWIFRYKPLEIEVMSGSLRVPGKSFALVVFVHKDNPVSTLTLAQLDAIFGCEHRRGLNNIRTWRQLGLKGEWEHKPIRAYMYDAETGTGSFFEHVVMKDSHKWNWERIKEYENVPRPDGSVYESSQQILDALGKDRYGIGIASLGGRNLNVKPLAIASQEGGPYYEASEENLIWRRYPLTRIVRVYVNRAPGRPIDPKVKEFLRYVLSREGQEAVVRQRDYLPLNAEAIQEQLKKLD